MLARPPPELPHGGVLSRRDDHLVHTHHLHDVTDQLHLVASDLQVDVSADFADNQLEDRVEVDEAVS